MQHYLARKTDQVRTKWIKRFAPPYWTVDFSRPMMAAVTMLGRNGLRVDLDFLTKGDLAGLIWDSEDRWSHPLLAYATDKDYRGTQLSFDWVAGPGAMPLDVPHGATLTIEGRDEAGVSRNWYVRLWNYASGTPKNARIELDFDNLQSGYGMEDGPVFAGDIDRLFISLVGEAYGGSDPLAQPVQTFFELRNIKASGRSAGLKAGDAWLPEHELRMCSGYDDSYHQVPERLVEQWRALGYRGDVNHYLGMSHHYAVEHVGGGRFEVAGGMCASARAWHQALARALVAAEMGMILSVSYELFDENAPVAWAQKNSEGERALTGWSPPSTLLSPCNSAAMSWLQAVAVEAAVLHRDAGLDVQFQVGEPWWWVGFDGKPCFYDVPTVSRWTGEKGAPPPIMLDVNGERGSAEQSYLDWLGARLSESTAALIDAVKTGVAGPVKTLLLFFAPQVLDRFRPDLWRANMPLGWSAPAVDILQLEDYDFVTADNEAGMQRGVEAVQRELNYAVDRQHYLAGFVLDRERAELEWPLIADAAKQAFMRGVSEVFVWAWPQIARDGFTWLSMGTEIGERDGVQAFHDVLFPLELGFDAVGGPEFQTQVASLASGHEQRNVQWAQARLTYDAGLGVRSETDLSRLLEFFRARRGQAFGFRFRDPLDWHSGVEGISPTDQLLGVGDGQTLSFPLVKRYGVLGLEEVRKITRPVHGSVRVSVNQQEVHDWQLVGGVVRFDEPPEEGAEVHAGFAFDVPVRFAADRLEISLSAWRAGEPVSVPLVEIRE